MDFEIYRAQTTEDVRTCLTGMAVQPILFVGSGLSQRYFHGPSWEALLSEMKNMCPLLDNDFGYYKQKHLELIDIGTVFSDAFREWAWTSGRRRFPSKHFEASSPSSVYLKHMVCKHLKKLLPDKWKPAETLETEIDALRTIGPHAIITTNYDQLLEHVFVEYKPIVGQRILHANYSSIGEILKIHGCVTEPESLTLNREDYNEFKAKKKYLSAKLLTFFSEHPLVFLGYRASDPNVQAILADIDEILSPNGELIPNIYLVEWLPGAEATGDHPREALISVGSERGVRVKRICADSFEWVYDCFKSDSALEAVNPKLLRALMARTFQLVRHDIPKRKVEVDYTTLEHAVSQDGELAKLYGITTLANPSAVNARYPFSLTQVAKELGHPTWHKANQLIDRLAREKEVNLKASDNKYHVAIMAGSVMQTHKYSQAAVDLLRSVETDEPYNLDL